MQATARRLSVVSATSCARRRLIRNVRLRNERPSHFEHALRLHTGSLSMKTAVVLSNVLLAAIGLWGGFAFLPRVYQQAHFQFTDPRGGPSMWPGTFNGALYVASFFACLASLSWLFNRSLLALQRLAALGISVLLFAGWCINAYLSSAYMPEFYGPMRPSFASCMIGFEGLPYLITALIALIISAAFGRGPVALIAQRVSGK